jgi:hypothetical protein
MLWPAPRAKRIIFTLIKPGSMLLARPSPQHYDRQLGNLGFRKV